MGEHPVMSVRGLSLWADQVFIERTASSMEVSITLQAGRGAGAVYATGTIDDMVLELEALRWHFLPKLVAQLDDQLWDALWEKAVVDYD